jgi:hypothetical protein
MSFDDNFKALASKPTGAFNIVLSPIRYLNNSFYASGQVARRGEIMVATGLVGSEVDM